MRAEVEELESDGILKALRPVEAVVPFLVVLLYYTNEEVCENVGLDLRSHSARHRGVLQINNVRPRESESDHSLHEVLLDGLKGLEKLCF
jgi:hypothetical protein